VVFWEQNFTIWQQERKKERKKIILADKYKEFLIFEKECPLLPQERKKERNNNNNNNNK